MIKTLRKLWKNHGGLHLDYKKQQSNQQSSQVIRLKAGQVITLPLQQHAGQKAKPLVKVGDYVYKGQTIAEASGRISSPIHASTSGTVTAISTNPIPHPSHLSDNCIVIEADGKDDWGNSKLEALSNYRDYTNDALSQRIHEAGVVGLGGAVFPAAIKLHISPETKIETLILNGAECEPYITCDDLLMQEKADEIVAGIQVMQHMVKPKQCLIGIEDNKPQAIATMQKAVEAINDPSMEVVSIPTIYPSGGAKQLTYILTGKEVPSGGRSTDIGVICHNVGTAHTIYNAVIHGKPLLERYVTVTGQGIKQPQNFIVPFGTSIETIIEAAGGYQVPNPILDMGGPMMPTHLDNDQLPIVKATNCILVREQEQKPAELPCIRCGSCADACPANLLPQQLFWHSRAKEFEATEKLKLFDCIECGCCEYVCPSHIPLVDYYRFAKSEVYAQRTARQKADVAKERHDFRQARLERLEAEKAARLAKHRKNVKSKANDTSTQSDADKKKAAIQAALERAKAKKAGMEQRNTENLTPEQQQKVDEAERKKAAVREAMERAKAKKAARTNETNQADSTEDDAKAKKIAAVKAAQARAKAKKEAQASEPENSEDDARAKKIAAVKAAQARAKAKKEAQTSESENSEDDARAKKIAAVKAAQAKAKARKAQQDIPEAPAMNLETPTPQQAANDEDAKAKKLAAIKAAQARAKARKTQKDAS